MIEALTLMKAHGSELHILSDANTVYIETILKVKMLRKRHVDNIEPRKKKNCLCICNS